VTKRGGRSGPGPLVIAGMTLADVPAVMEIENRSFPTPWSASSFRHELTENPYASLFVVRNADPPGVIGFASVWVVDEELKINNIAIHPKWRSRGIGTRLVRFLLEFAARQGCREATLEVRPSNEAALRLYRRTGFVAVGRRKNYYTDSHEDAVVMVRPVGLPGPA